MVAEGAAGTGHELKTPSMHVRRPQTPRQVLRAYFGAKDENRPHRLDMVFTPQAVLTVRNHASSIAFPATTAGRAAIANVLVREFGATYENVYSFYLASPPEDAPHFSCDWLVGMTAKGSGQARVGCGSYDWSFDVASCGLADRLQITIHAMQVVPADAAPGLIDALTALDYPWTSAAQALDMLPGLPELEPVRRYLAKNMPGT